MPGLVLFLHGLGGNRDSWGRVPDFLQKSPIGFKVDSVEYQATHFGAADIDTSSRQLLTQLETKYEEYDPIYLVGYSLGGLIARELCRKLLLSGPPDDTLVKLGGVVTLGSPLEGARLGNRLLRIFPFFSPKISEITHDHFTRYQEAINKSIERRVKRPRHFHLELENDGVIARQMHEHFTEDDVPAGVIPGTHMDFAGNDEDASYVADVILRQIRRSQNSLSRPNIRRTEPTPSAELPDRLLLIACSHGKKPGGTKLDVLDPAAWVLPASLRQRVMDRRSYVFSILEDAKLADGFERGGNRKHQPANRDLKHGPDLGGVTVIGGEGLYLPAWQRYDGRFYGQVSPDAWGHYHAIRPRLGVLIMSGLYGLLDPDEMIQNYDVHLTDTHVDSGQSVSSMWTELFTELLNTYIARAHRSREVRIINLLCDEHYVDAVVWHKLSTDCVVYHLASPTLRDVSLLPPAGIIFDAFVRDPDRLEHLGLDSIMELSSFGTPPRGLSGTQIVFESKVGGSKL